MDGYEATRTVFSRIQSLDAENVSKIMGLLLIQDQGEKEMIRLAFGSETLLHSVILQAKKELQGLSSPASSASTPSSASPVVLSRQTSSLNPASLPFYSRGSSNMLDDFQLQDQLSFLNETSSAGIGWRPCHYFARGFCKNGSSCRFVHCRSDAACLVGSPDGKIDMMMMMMMEQSHEILRSKRLAAASLMMGEDMAKFGRCRLDPASRQIYLTFPADSTFREEDVSNYFSIYGPVEDVRIPYQQKRMFGFVTFAYPETVKLILAKGNPHFVCDARVLVKPYKEKGKVLDKKEYQHQQVDGGKLSPCGTPTGIDAREPFNHPLGIRMSCKTQDMLWRRKLEEEADFQQALELQSRRLMDLQLLDVNKHHNQSQQHHQRALSTGSPIPSPQSHNLFIQSAASLSPLCSSMNFPPPTSPSQDNCSSSSLPAISIVPPERQWLTSIDASGKESNGHVRNGSGKENSHHESNDLLQESFEHILPDSPFASPTKDTAVDASPLDMESFRSFNCQMPR
ncbi:Zinc finger CCCH domain-containing protein 46 [Linum grandiflorum]